MKTIKLKVSALSEYGDFEDADHFKVELTPDFLSQLEKAAKAVQELDAAYLLFYDRPELLTAKGKEASDRFELSFLSVSKTDFHYEGVIKHTEMHFESDLFSIEVARVLGCPEENLPLLIGYLKSKEGIAALEKRLKKRRKA